MPFTGFQSVKKDIKKTQVRLEQNAFTFDLKRKCILLETHLRFI